MQARPVPTVRRSSFEVRVEPVDAMRWLTVLSLAGVAAAVVLAVIGGFPLDVPMPTHAVGWVEATCGLTRGSTAIARGDWALAFRYNPGSFVVMGLGAAGVARTVSGLVTRRWLNVSWRPPRYAWLGAVALFVVWTLYQQTNAEFIINSRA